MPKQCKFIDDQAVLSDNDEDDEEFGSSKKKKNKKVKRKIASSDEDDDDDQPTAEDLAFIDNSHQVDARSDVSDIHTSEEDLCSGDEVILREARGTRIRQAEDSGDEFSGSATEESCESQDEEENESCEDPMQQTSIRNYFVKTNQPVSSQCAKAHISNNDEKKKASFQPLHLKHLKSFSEMEKRSAFFGDHVEEVKKPAPKVQQIQASWDFLKPQARNKQQDNENSKVPGIIRTSEGLFYENKQGKRIRINEGQR